MRPTKLEITSPDTVRCVHLLMAINNSEDSIASFFGVKHSDLVIIYQYTKLKEQKTWMSSITLQ